LMGKEWSGSQVYRCLPSSADIKNDWKYPSIPGLY
jgi:hypothetical protein